MGISESAPFHYGAALRKLTQDKDKVHQSVTRGGALEQVEADRVILAIPFSTLRNVELDDSFSAQKRAVIFKLRYDSATHVYLQSRNRFWIEQGISGFAMTDLPIRVVLNLHRSTRDSGDRDGRHEFSTYSGDET